jgi:hypothetical protein
MGDAGEGLVDASSRLAERMEEIEEARQLAKVSGPAADAEYVRTRESLRLTRTSIERQIAATTHPARRAQLEAALADVQRRFAELTG